VSHVIRGEEHLPNTPKQLLLWAALDVATGDVIATPQYAHLPVLVNEQRKKLSKRRDPVAVESYRDQGYLPEAFSNYLSLLGWSPRGDLEKVPQSTCIEQFHLEDVSHSSAFFDVKKLTHLNGEYIRDLSLNEFVQRCAPWVRPWSTTWQPSDRQPPWNAEQFDERVFAQVAPLVQERVSVLSEVVDMVDFFFLSDVPMDEEAFAKSIGNDKSALEMLTNASVAFADCLWAAATLHELTISLGEELGLSLRKAQAPIRCAVTGRSVGPPLFESLELLGRDRVLERIEAALSRAVT
jgi:glutamyl-tRNA synthetase